jgi:hypothetical protein
MRVRNLIFIRTVVSEERGKGINQGGHREMGIFVLSVSPVD